MQLTIFDFDGTITKTDSFHEFIVFAKGPLKTAFGYLFLSPIITLYILKILSNSHAKQIVFGCFFKNTPEDHFKEVTHKFAYQRIPQLVKKSATDKIRWHQQRGDTLLIISASFEDYLKPWADQLGIEVLATKVEKNSGQVTGTFASPNCHGQEKVNRLRSHIDLKQYTHITVYGDSRGDRELYEIATEVHHKDLR